MGSASWRVQRPERDISRNWDFLEPGNAKFCSPVQNCSPRLEPRPQLSSTFGLSRPYRNFRKNFRESLAPPNSVDRVTPILATQRGRRISTSLPNAAKGYPPRARSRGTQAGVAPDDLARELAGAVGEGATPCTDGRPSENTPPWMGLHQSSLPNAAKGSPPREPREPPRNLENLGVRTQRGSRTSRVLAGQTWQR